MTHQQAYHYEGKHMGAWGSYKQACMGLHRLAWLTQVQQAHSGTMTHQQACPCAGEKAIWVMPCSPPHHRTSYEHGIAWNLPPTAARQAGIEGSCVGLPLDTAVLHPTMQGVGLDGSSLKTLPHAGWRMHPCTLPVPHTSDANEPLLPLQNHPAAEG